MKIFKDTLVFLQIIALLMIPCSVAQFLFPAAKFFSFAKVFNDSALNMFSGLIGSTVNGIDLSLIFIALPWVIYIILINMVLNLCANLTIKIDDNITIFKQKQIQKLNKQQEQLLEDELIKKTFTYLAISLVFSKFTISTLSENEINAKKDEIKNKLVKDNIGRGKLLEDDEFDDENTFAVLFYSQEDAINYVYKVKEQVKILDNDLQEYGYSIGYRIMMDVQPPEAIKFYILEFLERALSAVELDETCTTADFAKKYKNDYTPDKIDFSSKGNYSINKERVEIRRLEEN